MCDPRTPSPRPRRSGCSLSGRPSATSSPPTQIPVDRVTPIDWQSNDAFPGWFQQLEQSIPADAFTPGRDPFDTWLQTRGTAYDLVMTTEADARTKLADAAGAVRDSSTVLYPQPVATADVVLTPVAGGREPFGAGRRPARRARRPRLSRRRFDRARRGPALGDTDGLPSAGALYAIRGLWAGVVR